MIEAVTYAVLWCSGVALTATGLALTFLWYDHEPRMNHQLRAALVWFAAGITLMVASQLINDSPRVEQDTSHPQVQVRSEG